MSSIESETTIQSLTRRARLFDKQGQWITPSPVERKARSEALARAIREIETTPDDDPPGIEAEMMRAIDSERPHRPLFEGMY